MGVNAVQWYKDTVVSLMPSKLDVYAYPAIRHSPFSVEVIRALRQRFPPSPTPRDHQQLVRQHFKTASGLLVVHGTGTGKTLTASYVASDFLHAHPTGIVLLVTPPGVLSQFYAQLATVVQPGHLRQVFPMGLQTVDTELRQDRRGQLKQILSTYPSLLIIDEAHYINNSKSAMTKRFFELASRATKVLLMTATPITNKVSELGTLLAFVARNPSLLGTDLARATDEDFEKAVRCNVSVYMNDTQKNSDFPTIVEHAPIDIPITDETYWSSVVANNKPDAKIRYAHERVQLSKSAAKFDIILDILKRYPGKTIVYAEMKEVVQKLKQVLKRHGIPQAMIVGDTPTKQRRNLVTAFSEPNGQTRVMILSKAGMVGLDFKRVRNLIFLELPWNFSDYQQIVGRAVRYKSHPNSPGGGEVNIFIPLFKAPNNAPRQLFNRAAFTAIQRKKSQAADLLSRVIPLTIEKASCQALMRRVTRAFDALVARRRKAAPGSLVDPRPGKRVRFIPEALKSDIRASIRQWLMKTWAPRNAGTPPRSSRPQPRRLTRTVSTTALDPQRAATPSLERISAPGVLVANATRAKGGGNRKPRAFKLSAALKDAVKEVKQHAMRTRSNARRRQP